MRAILLVFAASAAACAPAPAPVSTIPAPAPAATQPDATSRDGRSAIATVQRLFDAMRTRDTAAMRQIFDPNARLYGLRTRRDSSMVVQVVSGSDFIGAVAASSSGPVWNERMFNAEARVSGALATVWAEYDFHAGTEFSHCGVDAVQLARIGENWRIVSIADTFVRTGCPSRPAPARDN